MRELEERLANLKADRKVGDTRKDMRDTAWPRSAFLPGIQEMAETMGCIFEGFELEGLIAVPLPWVPSTACP